MVIRTDIFVMAVFHSKAIFDCSKLNKSKPLIQMSCVNIRCYNCIELKNSKTVLLSLNKTIAHKFFTDMKSAKIFVNRITCITNMTAAAHVIRVQDIDFPSTSATPQ